MVLTPVFYVVIRRVLERRKAAPAGSLAKAAATGASLFLVLGSLSLGLLSGGCSVGPNYHPPKTEVGAAFVNGAQTNLRIGQHRHYLVARIPGPDPQRPDWPSSRDQPGPPNRDRARARGWALRTQAVADAFPVVDATAGYNKSLSSKDSSPFPLTRSQRELQLFSAGFDATWEVDIFGHARRSIEAGSADLAAAQASLQDTWISLIAEMARNYFELRGEQNQLAVARENAQNQQETLDLTVSKLNAGRATELDTARARAQLNSTLAAIPPLEAGVKHSIYRLAVLSGAAARRFGRRAGPVGADPGSAAAR